MNKTVNYGYVVMLLGSIFLASNAYASSIKMFYFEDGTRGWRGGYKTVEECEKSAKQHRYTSNQYYCSESQDYEIERRLGWRK